MDNRLKVIAGAVLIAGLYWGYQMFGTATLAVTSEPSGAVVRVDGRQRGITPMARLEVDSGSHRLEVVHSHYAPYSEGLTVRRGDHEARFIKFELGEGTLELLSNPRGAWVEVDGQRLPDRTPTQFTTTSGPHVIAMGQTERRIVEETHTLNAGEQLEVNFNLNIDPHGSVTIATTPRNAKIEFVNEDIIYKPKVRVQIGEYAIRVSFPGYITQEFRYNVRYGDNLHNVALKREYGALKVATDPADADVQVSYTEGGRTYRKTYTREMTIPVGKVEVRARALGYRTAFRTLALDNSGATLRLNLKPMQVKVGAVVTDQLADGTAAPQMVIVPAGSFQMGDASGPVSERPVRSVTLTQPFAVSRYEVTIGDYLSFARATGRSLHERIDPTLTDHAMAYVSFKDAVEYADWLSQQTGQRYRLLSEAEWEYVARAGSKGKYFFGEDPEELCAYANVADRSTRKVYREWETLTCDDKMVRPGAVGTYQPNPFGVYDIYGNVAEWVLDCGMPEYQSAPTDGAPAAEGIGCTTHGIRGGSWDSLAAEASSSYRNTSSNLNDDRGIRLLREL